MMWQALFTLSLSAAVATALLSPSSLELLKVDSSFLLGTACFFLGLGTNPARFRDLVGTPYGLGNIAFSYVIGTFLWPALGLAAAVLVVQQGLPFSVAVGLALLAACPVGGPSNAVNANTAGGSLECSVLMCFLSTPAALITLPYAFRHFLLLLLDQTTITSTPATELESNTTATTTVAAVTTTTAIDLQLRNQLAFSLDLPQSVIASLQNHAIFAATLPLAAGAAVSALLPTQIAASVRGVGPMVAAAMIVLTASSRTAAGAGAIAAAGPMVAVAVLALHVSALVLGFLIPAGVGSPGRTCRTTAYQASMRNSALGLVLATTLFGGSPALPLVAAPCVASILVQNTLGAWTALLGAVVPPRRPVSEASGVPLSPQAFRANSMEAILRQQTFKRTSLKAADLDSKED